MKSMNSSADALKFSHIWAQIDPALLDDVYDVKSAVRDQDFGLMQKIKSNVLSRVNLNRSPLKSSIAAPKDKASISRYRELAWMAATLVIVVGLSWFFRNIFSSYGPFPTAGLTTIPVNPTQMMTTKLNPTQATSQGTQGTQSSTAASHTIVRSDQYLEYEIDILPPVQGEMIISAGVRSALNEPSNEKSYFYVRIYIKPAEQYENEFNAYIYHGYSIAEWSELVDLGNGTYPFDEYNSDHGGNVTLDVWKAAQEMAKTLSAQENHDAAVAEYDNLIRPGIIEAQAAWEKSECKRLDDLGYDVFLAQTWTYIGLKPDIKRQYWPILAGLLSKEQLLSFKSNGMLGYVIDWVHNGDGIVNWSE